MATTPNIWSDMWRAAERADGIWLGVSALLFAVVLVGLFCAAYFYRKKNWDSLWFCLLCAVLLLWCAGEAARYAFILWPVQGRWPLWGEAGRITGHVLSPALLYMHLRRQVTYKEMRWPAVLAAFGLPGGYAVWLWAEAAGADTAGGFSFGVNAAWPRALYVVYAAAMFAQCYLLLLRVFYQMPRHMRRPSMYSLAGLTAFTAAALLQQLFRRLLPFEVMLLGGVVLLCTLYYALGATPSADVIATSRDYVLQNLSTLVVVLSRRRRILDWNPREGPCLAHLPQPAYRESFAAYRRRMLESGGRTSPLNGDIITYMQDGAEYHYLLRMRELDSAKRQYGYLVEISEVTQIYSLLRTLEESATIDQLTGLHNRNAYLERVAGVMVEENLPLLVLVGDVNNLKPLNDLYGHLAGDQLLVSVAAAIRRAAPAGAFAARIGGDEFVVLAPRAGAGEAVLFIEEADARCKDILQADGYPTGVSWGWAVVESAGQEYNRVFEMADRMMYAAKKQHAQFRSAGLLPPPESAERPPAGRHILPPAASPAVPSVERRAAPRPHRPRRGAPPSPAVLPVAGRAAAPTIPPAAPPAERHAAPSATQTAPPAAPPVERRAVAPAVPPAVSPGPGQGAPPDKQGNGR